MKTEALKRNERDWAGQLISWLKAAINQGITVFQDATNDTSVKLDSGKTKFPDILLFSDKISGVVFNGWELKFPDTAVDDTEMLENALEKAAKLQSNSFVTWNGSEAIIWKINAENYSLSGLTKIKQYHKIPSINNRNDMAEVGRFVKHESALKARALEILHDLDQLFKDGELKPAINVSGNIISAISITHAIIVPQLRQAIAEKCDTDSAFRKEFNLWKIYEGATLKILESSSRRIDAIDPYEVLGKFTFYNLIGKTLFYLTLSENLSGELPPLRIKGNETYSELSSYFAKAKDIDYQAIFQPYFTDSLPYSNLANLTLKQLIDTLTAFDFKVLPTEVIGHILENIVPNDEKQKFGQYFTPDLLAHIVAFPAVQTRHSCLFDPTSGTGSFLNAFYAILKYFGATGHQQLLNQIWGNDISHFPAILSVINLYKQDVAQTDNFPRVMRNDFFNLKVGKEILFPDSHDHRRHNAIAIPQFDGIASNFPFIQQEDIPHEELTAMFRQHFKHEQTAFACDGNFKINERSDYFTYCTYNALRFLKVGGILSAITSNAWLGKEYGHQFKDFLLNNFHIKYVVKSNAEHWFNDSQVATIFIVLEKKQSTEPTRFVSLNFKLQDYFKHSSSTELISKIESLYTEIDNCDNPRNSGWVQSQTFSDLYLSNDRTVSVAVIPKKTLSESLAKECNWAQFFISARLFEAFDPNIIQYHGHVVNVIRGERTGWNPMFVIPIDKIGASEINQDFLRPYIKSPSEFQTIAFDGNSYKYNVFICDKPIDHLDAGTHRWIEKFKDAPNKNGSAPISVACAAHKPFWYSIAPKSAHIVTAVNPYERFFFSYATEPFIIDQRLIAMQVINGHDVELVAALLNSAVTFLTIEMRGTPRNLGALDLNANYLKKLQLLDPDKLSSESKQRIIDAFQPLKHTKIESIIDEIRKPARIKFDRTVLSGFGYDEAILELIYNLLANAVTERISMKNR